MSWLMTMPAGERRSGDRIGLLQPSCNPEINPKRQLVLALIVVTMDLKASLSASPEFLYNEKRLRSLHSMTLELSGSSVHIGTYSYLSCPRQKWKNMAAASPNILAQSLEIPMQCMALWCKGEFPLHARCCCLHLIKQNRCPFQFPLNVIQVFEWNEALFFFFLRHKSQRKTSKKSNFVNFFMPVLCKGCFNIIL